MADTNTYMLRLLPTQHKAHVSVPVIGEMVVGHVAKNLIFPTVFRNPWLMCHPCSTSYCRRTFSHAIHALPAHVTTSWVRHRMASPVAECLQSPPANELSNQRTITVAPRHTIAVAFPPRFLENSLINVWCLSACLPHHKDNSPRVELDRRNE